MTLDIDPLRVRAAWSGRITGCLLGKPVEVLSYREGPSGVARYLERANALPLEDYVPALDGSEVRDRWLSCCRGHIERFEADDDINYTVLALLLLEQHGPSFTVADVARQWLLRVPAGATWTAERAAYATLLARMDSEFVNGSPPGFDLADCSANDCNEWIGAQIRADLYGWVCPGQPELAAELATRDGSLSHRGEGLHGAAFVAAWAAAIPAADSPDSAIDVALDFIPSDSAAAAAVRFGRHAAARGRDADCIHDEYAGLSPVHTLNNLAIVVWSLCASARSFDRAVSACVLAGLDTDSNAATVGGLAGIAGYPLDRHWTDPWAGRVSVDLAGHAELDLDDLVARSVAVSRQIIQESGMRGLARVAACTVALVTTPALADGSHAEGRSLYQAPGSTTPITVDGMADDPVWQNAEWRAIDQRWLGPEYTHEDFNGRFKVAWTGDRLHLLVEFTDDILFDSHRDPLVQYWDDDCLEIFLDEDFSGGDHQFNHNAFAYHFSLDNRAIDIGTDRQAREYTDHVESHWRQEGDKVVWEVSIQVFDDSYVDGSDANEPVALHSGKRLGLMVAYCDNDGSELRENFIGSETVPTGPKDRGWIDAGLFGELLLEDVD